MGANAVITITPRVNTGKGAMNRLRREGFLPGSISHKGEPSVSFSMVKDDFRKSFGAIGMSGIYLLQSAKKKTYTAMIREIQHVPGSYDFLHVTFQAISLKEETTADIPLHIAGKEALHRHGLELIQQMEHVHLKGLPSDFPTAIEIDVSGMAAGEHLTVAELKLPTGIHSVSEADRIVLSVSHSKIRKEELDETENAAETAAAQAEGGKPAEQGVGSEQ